MARKLDGRRMIITGAGNGMGRAIARLFALEGARLALIDIDPTRIAQAAAEVGGLACACACDVSDPHLTKSVVEEAIGQLGGLDGIVNAAGVLVIKEFDNLDIADWRRMIDVNLTGPFNVIKASLPALRAAQDATITNIASVSSYVPVTGTSGYGATKAGLLMFSKGLAVDLAPKIRVNALCPGVIQTEMTRYLWEDPERLAQVTEAAALKRVGTPDDIARAALFLSCSDSSFITGTQIVLDGGYSWR